MSDMEPKEDLSQILRHRREKLEQVVKRGMQPFAYNYSATSSTVAAVEGFEAAETAGTLDEEGHSEPLKIGGRLVGWRDMGRSVFAHLEDGQGSIQLYFRNSVVGESSFEALAVLDVSDWIGVEGRMFRTRTGEVTIQVEGWTLLTKSLRPLPFGKVETDAQTGERRVYGGLQDQEGRYRQRYADLAVHPEVREVFRTRAKVITELRRFLDAEGFLEVETPVLQPLYGGASARPFVTHHHSLDQRMYLRIADELYLKRLVVGGFERVYEIAKDFRNEGLSRVHNPEFTMLEWYQAFSDYEDQMGLVERMLVHVLDSVVGERVIRHGDDEIPVTVPFRRLGLVSALSEAIGEDVHEMSLEDLMGKAQELGISDLEGSGRGKLIDKLFGELVEPKLIEPTFVIDHPKELSPLAKVHRGDDRLTERFEMYIGGAEIFNGFSELNDPIDQRDRFEAQAALRDGGDEEAQQIYDDYIRALEYGMPPTGGVGMGVDRLVMMLTGQSSIRDVILFPILRVEE